MLVKRTAYLVTSRDREGIRTYVCLDLPAVFEVVARVTGRAADTLSLDARGLPATEGILIASDVHVYGSDMDRAAELIERAAERLRERGAI